MAPPLLVMCLGQIGLTLSACLVLMVSMNHAPACLMPPGSNDQDYKNYGATFTAQKKALWLKQILNDGSGVGYASATPINAYYAITSAHLLYGFTVPVHFEVGLGPNFLTGSEATSAVSSISIYPGYDGTRNGPDIAIVKLATPLPNFQPVTFGAAVPGELVTAGGYGYAYRPEDAIPSMRDGFIRAWDGEIIAGAPSASSDTYYDRTLFGTSGPVLKGKILNGDSGKPVYSTSGRLVGLNTAQSGNKDPVGTSIYLVLSQPEVFTWIQANTALPAALPDLRLTPAPTGPAMRLTWDADATGFRLQTSGTGSGWTDLGPLITAPGTLDDPIADRPRRFYRLAKP